MTICVNTTISDDVPIFSLAKNRTVLTTKTAVSATVVNFLSWYTTTTEQAM